MTPPIENLLQQLTEQIGWVLLHSVWQIAVIAVLFAVARAIIRSSQANTATASFRTYWLGCIALGLMALVPLLTTFAQNSRNVEGVHKGTTMFPALVEGMVIGSSESRFLELANPEVTDHEVDSVRFMAVAPSQPWIERSSGTFGTELISVLHRLGWLQPWLVVSWLLGVLLFSLRPMLGARQVYKLRRSMVPEVPRSLHRRGQHLGQELG